MADGTFNVGGLKNTSRTPTKAMAVPAPAVKPIVLVVFDGLCTLWCTIDHHGVGVSQELDVHTSQKDLGLYLNTSRVALDVTS